jgi:mycofactocin system glycosyltransferase
VNACTPLPDGYRIAVDADTKQLTETTLFGGSPVRVLRLSATGLSAWAELKVAAVHSSATAALARRLTDAGLAHPRPPGPVGIPDITVIIPVKDRPTLLAQCLSSLGHRYPVVVVDDGSRDPSAVAEVAARHSAKRLHRGTSGGPGAARDTGFAGITSEFVAFIDSDCIASSGWIERLAAHFADPLVAAVAPRIAAVPSMTSAGRYAATSGSLDLGEREARVVPGTRVAYVPTAALLVRTAALRAVARGGRVFDPELRYGEDVDLVWRLHEAGWRIRYQPDVVVRHHEPGTWSELVTRRFRYGTSAAPLARRHPGAVAPLVLQPWPTLAVAGLLTRHPSIAVLAFAASVLATNRTLRDAELPTAGVTGAMLTGVRQTWLGIGRYGTQFGAPLLAAVLMAPYGTPAKRWGRRAAVASLLLGPPLTALADRRPALDPVRFILGQLADDLAYGAGVLAGCAHARTMGPIRPVISWRPFRIGRRGARASTPTPQTDTEEAN